jgi:hypothetical protein
VRSVVEGSLVVLVIFRCVWRIVEVLLQKNWEERQRGSKKPRELSDFSFWWICWRKRLYLRGCVYSVNKIQELLFFLWIASVWKYRTGDVCCVIVVLLCLSVFESLKIRKISKAWTSFGDDEVLVGVRSIWRTWTPWSTEESTCVARFPDPLLFGYNLTTNFIYSCWHTPLNLVIIPQHGGSLN